MSKKRLHKGPAIKRRECPSCKGTGVVPGKTTALVRCVNCEGKGVTFTLGDPEQGRLRGQ